MLYFLQDSISVSQRKWPQLFCDHCQNVLSFSVFSKITLFALEGCTSCTIVTCLCLYTLKPGQKTLKPFSGKRRNLKDSHRWGLPLPGMERHALIAPCTENMSIIQYKEKGPWAHGSFSDVPIRRGSGSNMYIYVTWLIWMVLNVNVNVQFMVS